MFAALQSDLVGRLDAQRTGLVSGDGEKAPALVEPYAGQLLRSDDLLDHVPALYVDIQEATIAPENESGSLRIVGSTVELIVVTVNESAASAPYNEGLQVAAWALRAAIEAGIVTQQSTRFERIASGDTLYAAKLTTALQHVLS